MFLQGSARAGNIAGPWLCVRAGDFGETGTVLPLKTVQLAGEVRQGHVTLRYAEDDDKSYGKGSKGAPSRKMRSQPSRDG